MMPADSQPPKRPEIQIPPELLAAVKPHVALRPRNLDVEGWQPSFFGRIAELLRGKRR
jgi:hypothetical protein